MGDQVNALLVVYGPRTTAILYNSNQDKVQEFTLIENEWIISHDHCVINEKTKIFSPGNLRCASEHEEYMKVVANWIQKGYTLRYTGGLIVDVAQIFIKRHGVFCCVGSKNHKFKLRALYEAAAVGFLIEKAGGKSISFDKKSILDIEIRSMDDRMYLFIDVGRSQLAVLKKSTTWPICFDSTTFIHSFIHSIIDPSPKTIKPYSKVLNLDSPNSKTKKGRLIN